MARKLYGADWHRNAGRSNPKGKKKKKAHRRSYTCDSHSAWWDKPEDESEGPTWMRWSSTAVWGEQDLSDESSDNGHTLSSSYEYQLRVSTRPKARQQAGRNAAWVVLACEKDVKAGKPMWPDMDARCHRAAGNLYSYDACLKEWARNRAVTALKLRGEDADEYALGMAARAAIDTLRLDEWLDFARFYIPEGDTAGESDFVNDTLLTHGPGGFFDTQRNDVKAYARNSDSLLTRESDEQARVYHDAADAELRLEEARLKHGGLAAGHYAGDFTKPRYLKPGQREDCSDLAAAMEDARREILVSDWSGSDLGPDAAMWACGATVSPLAEREARMRSPMEVAILVDGSSSTAGRVSEILSKMSFAFAGALREAGHCAAVAPWGSGYTPLRYRVGTMLWNDPMPDLLPVWANSGTELRDAALVGRLLFEQKPRTRSRRLALVLTDGCCSVGLNGMKLDFGADIVALWSFAVEPPKDWRDHKLFTQNPSLVMADLRASELVRALSAL